MVKRILVAGLLAFASVQPANALFTSDPIVDQVNVAIPARADGGMRSVEEIQRIIMLGCSDMGWIPSIAGPQVIRARLAIRSHVAEVDIPFTAQSFSILFSSAVNLDFNPGNRTIHKNYNKWVVNLRESISKRFVIGDFGQVPRGAAPGGSPDVGAASSGSGFFVADNGLVMTSYHIVAGATKITVKARNGESSEARIIASSEATDLAVLETQLRGRPYLSLAPIRSAKVGMPVFTLGYPVTDVLGVEPKFTDGTISALSGIQNEQAFMQISVPVQPGNSGGPLVNEKAQVVGIITSQAAIAPFFRHTGTLPQNINWALKSDYAALLAELPPPQLEAKTRDEAITRVSNAVCLIEARR